MKKILNLSVAVVLFPLFLDAASNEIVDNRPAQKSESANTVSGRVGKVSYWAQVIGLGIAAPGAISSVAGTTTMVTGRSGAKAGSVIAFQFGAAFLIGGIKTATIASTVGYLAEGKVQVFAKADIYNSMMAMLNAVEETPESSKPHFSNIVLSLNRGNEALLASEIYPVASQNAVRFLKSVDLQTKAYKNSSAPVKISLDTALAITARAAEEAQLTNESSLESQFSIAHRLMALNEIYVEEFVALNTDHAAN